MELTTNVVAMVTPHIPPDTILWRPGSYVCVHSSCFLCDQTVQRLLPQQSFVVNQTLIEKSDSCKTCLRARWKKSNVVQK